jgi:hypothetical protein
MAGDHVVRTLYTSTSFEETNMKEDRDIEKALSPVLLHCGVDLQTIADISGHDVATMLKHYAHSMSASRQDAISQLPTLHLLGAENDETLTIQKRITSI